MGVSSLKLDYYQKHVKSVNPNFGYINPTVIEERQLNVTQIDVFSRLLMDRIIFLGTGINEDVANIISAQLLFLQSADSNKAIELYCATPGGSVYAGLQIWDTMNIITPDVNTTAAGLVASMGFILSISGNKRYALKNSRLMMHQPSGGVQGVSMDIEISANEIIKLRKVLYDIIAEKTNHTYDEVYKNCERDYWMSAQEALEYGAIDEILEKKK